MALAYDTSTNSGAFANQGSLSWSHACSGSNRILVVGVSGAAADPSATYNGVSMTKLASHVQAAQGAWNALFYLINPASGSNTVSITWGGSGSPSAGAAVSLTGAKQSGQPDASGTQYATGNPSKAVTSVADHCWFVDFAGCNFFSSGQAFSSPTPGTQRQNVHNDVAGFGNALGMQTYGPVSPPASTTLGWTQGVSGDEHGYFVMSVVPLNQDYTLTAARGSFTLTGRTTLFYKAWKLIASVGLFVLTRIATVVHKIATITEDTRHTGTFTSNNKTSPATLTQDNKSVSTFTQDKRTP
jgi:hypothetical protein